MENKENLNPQQVFADGGSPSLTPLRFKEVAEKSDNSSIWKHFLREANGKFGKCKVCKKVITISQGSTSGLHYHLKSKHSINLLKRSAPAGKFNLLHFERD